MKPGMNLTTTAQAALWMALASVAFAMLSAVVRHVSADMHPIEIAFFRSLILLILMLTWRRGDLGVIRTERFGHHLFRASLGTGAMFGLFHAFSALPIAYATALTFAAPLFATVGAALFLRETVRLRRWTATMIGFAGTLLILWPNEAKMDIDALIALGAAVCMAGVMLCLRSLSRTESAHTMVTFAGLNMTVLMFIPALFVWQWPSMTQFLWMALVGLFALVTQQALARAFTAAEASVVLPFDFLRLVAATALGYLFFSEIPTGRTWAGSAVILAATVYIAHRESRLERKASQPADS